MLTSNELSDARSDVAETLTDVVILYRPTATISAGGEFTETFAAFGTVAGRLDPVSRSMTVSLVGEREMGRALYRLTLPYNTDVNAGDQVSMGAITYELTEILDTHSARIVVRCLVERLDD
jgi:head-tail adaptor